MITPFTPQVCQPGILTACLQEPFGRTPFEQDPMQAARDALTKYWIPLAGRQKLHLEVGGAFFFQDGYIDPKKMLDPVASHIPARTPRTGPGTDMSDADRDLILEACAKAGTTVRTIGIFENLLHDDDLIRAQIHEHVKRKGRAAKALGADGVTLFVGRNVKKLLDANWVQFITDVIPLFKYLTEELGLTVFLENCPMPGWNNSGLWVNNICNAPFTWLAIDEICKRFGLSGKVVVNYDASHTILQKGLVALTFAYLEAAGIEHMFGRVHCKDQHHNIELLAAAEGRGQTSLRGDYIGGQLGGDDVQWMGWCEMDSHHGMPGLKYYDPPAELAGHEVNWLEHQYLARRLLKINPAKFVVTLEHEWNDNRVKASAADALDRIEEMVAMSATFMRGIDQAADVMYRAETYAGKYGIGLPNTPDDRFVRYRPAMVKHADMIRERVSQFFKTAA